MKKKYVVYQKLLQTDHYEIEANSLNEALELYEKTKGELMSIGSTSGWAFDQNTEVFVKEKE